jgi:predicted MFS family arabinose efflux permease
MIPIVITNFFFSSISIIIPKIAEGVFHTGASGMGFMMSAFGGGMLVGTIYLSMVKKLPTALKFMLVSFILMGSSFFLMGYIMNFNFSLVTLFFIGFSLNISNIKLIVIFQQMLDTGIRGKVMALITSIALSLQPVSYGVTGIVLDYIKSSSLLMICGIIIILCGFYLFRINELKNI